MTESDKELADRLDAEDRLKARGMQKKTCEHCKGTGPISGCIPCGGKGYHWENPHSEMRTQEHGRALRSQTTPLRLLTLDEIREAQKMTQECSEFLGFKKAE